MRGTRAAAIVLAGGLLAGCGSDAFDFQFPWSDTGEPAEGRFEQAGVDDEDRQADRRACVESARAQVERDRRIDQSTEMGTADTTAGADPSADLRQRMEDYGYDQRLNRLIGACMQRKGYTVTEDAGE